MLLVPCILYAQDGYKRKIYNSDDGLPGTRVRNVFQDSRDFIWLGTASGLSMFDGRHFKNYNAEDGLYGEWVWDITEDEQGSIWIATTVGLFRMYANKFYPVDYQFPSINKIIAYQHKIWIATSKGLYIYDNGKVTLCKETGDLLSPKTTCFLKLADGKLLIITNKGACTYKDKFSVLWRTKEPEYVLTAAQDGQGKIWFCTLFSNVYCFKDSVRQVDLHIKEVDLPLRVIKDNSGDVTFIGDFAIYQTHSDTVVKAIPIVIADSSIVFYDGIQDIEGNYWVGSIYGLVNFKPQKITTIGLEKQIVFGIKNFENDSNTYVLLENALYRVVDKTLIKVLEINEDLRRLSNSHNVTHTHKNVDAVEKADDGSFILGLTSGAIVKYKDGKFDYLVRQDGFVDHSSVKQGSKIWFFEDRIFLYENGKIDSSYELPPDVHILGHASLVQKDYILLGATKGLIKFKDGNFTWLKIPVQDTSFRVRSLFDCKDGTLLIATSGHGLMRIRIEGDQVKIIYSFNSKNGLESDFIGKIVGDSSAVWVASNSGIYKIADYLTHPRILHLGAEDGLTTSFWLQYIGMSRTGNIYVGGIKGLSVFRQDAHFYPEISQKTHIINITVNNKAVNWGKSDSGFSFFGIPVGHAFSYKDNSISFYYTGINFGNAPKVKYEYFLENYQGPVQTTTSDNVTFFNLPPGTYNFKVRSTTQPFFSNEKYATFSFEIVAPFWQTSIFKLFVFSAFALLVFLNIRWRFAVLQDRKRSEILIIKELNENKLQAFQARMNPHFIFNSLNSIQSFVLNNDKVYALKYLSKFAKLLRQILDNSLRPKVNLELEIEMLRSYIEMEQLRFDNGFDYKIVLAGNIMPTELNIPAMIVQPFVENAILHGLMHKEEKGLLEISFSVDGQQLVCVVQDNGIGRAKSSEINARKFTKHQSQGTSIAINRLKLLNDPNAKIVNGVEFVDLMDNGSPAGVKVIIKMPIL